MRCIYYRLLFITVLMICFNELLITVTCRAEDVSRGNGYKLNTEKLVDILDRYIKVPSVVQMSYETSSKDYSAGQQTKNLYSKCFLVCDGQKFFYSMDTVDVDSKQTIFSVKSAFDGTFYQLLVNGKLVLTKNPSKFNKLGYPWLNPIVVPLAWALPNGNKFLPGDLTKSGLIEKLSKITVSCKPQNGSIWEVILTEPENVNSINRVTTVSIDTGKNRQIAIHVKEGSLGAESLFSDFYEWPLAEGTIALPKTIILKDLGPNNEITNQTQVTFDPSSVIFKPSNPEIFSISPSSASKVYDADVDVEIPTTVK